MDGPAEMRRCLEEVDVAGIRALWRRIAPGMPHLKNDHEALIALHYARTKSNWLRLTNRFYSHRWLLDHNMLSGLPDHLRPSAERIYPRVISSVGISINMRSELLQPVVPLIRTAVENAVNEAYADGKGDDIPFVKRRMAEARKTVTRKLLGS
jgi:hypothetical protein